MAFKNILIKSDTNNKGPATRLYAFGQRHFERQPRQVINQIRTTDIITGRAGRHLVTLFCLLETTWLFAGGEGGLSVRCRHDEPPLSGRTDGMFHNAGCREKAFLKPDDRSVFEVGCIRHRRSLGIASEFSHPNKSDGHAMGGRSAPGPASSRSTWGGRLSPYVRVSFL